MKEHGKHSRTFLISLAGILLLLIVSLAILIFADRDPYKSINPEKFRDNPVLAQLAGQLKNGTWEEKRDAVEKMGLLQDIAAVDILISILEDKPDIIDRIQYLWNYIFFDTEIFTMSNIDFLRETWKSYTDPRWELRTSAFDASCRIGGKKTFDSLLRFVKETEEPNYLIDLLGIGEGNETGKVLNYISGIKNENTYREAISYLSMRCRLPFEQIEKFLSVGKGNKNSLDFLRLLSSSKDIPPEFVMDFLSGDDETRREAAWILYSKCYGSSFPKLRSMLKSADWRERAGALEFFGLAADHRTFDDAAALLSDTEDEVVLKAITALEHIGSARAIPHLRKILASSKSSAVAFQAALSLYLLGDDQGVDLILKELAAREAFERQQGINAFLDSQDKRILDCFYKEIGDGFSWHIYWPKDWWEKEGLVVGRNSLIEAIWRRFEKWDGSSDRDSEFMYFANLLAGYKDQRIIEFLVEKIEEREFDCLLYPDERYSTLIDFIKASQNEELANRLLTVLKSNSDKYYDTRNSAFILSLWEDKRAIAPLLDIHNKQSDRAYLQCLLELKYEKMPDLILKNPSWDKFDFALEHKIAVDKAELLKLLSHDDWRIRKSALFLLAEPGEKDEVAKYLDGKNAYLRRNAACALARVKDTRALVPLLKLLQHPNGGTRVEAAEYLGMLGDKRAVRPLIKALDDDCFEVCDSSVSALGELKDQRAVRPILKLSKDYPNMYFAFDDSLSSIGGDEAIKAGVDLIHDKDSPYFREIGVEILQNFKDERAVDGLISALDDNSQTVRNAAVQALGEIGDPRTIPFLEKILADPDEGRKFKHGVQDALNACQNKTYSRSSPRE